MMRTVVSVFAAVLFAFTLAPAQTAVPDSSRWESAIEAFERDTRENPPTDNVIVFTGSSSIRFWHSMEEDLEPLKVLNRGFGGSQMCDLVRYARRIIIPLKPRAVVVFSGGNDIMAGKKAEEIAADFRNLVDIMRNETPQTAIYYLSIRPVPKFPEYSADFQAVNALIRDFCRDTQAAKCIDIWEQFFDPETGTVAEKYSGEDMVHMSRAGYELWASIIKPVLLDEVSDSSHVHQGRGGN